MKYPLVRNVVNKVVHDVVTPVVDSRGIPGKAILTKGGIAILTKDGKFILTK